MADLLASPPRTSMQIRGTHKTSKVIDVVDFDLWIDCARVAEIKSGQFLTCNPRDYRHWELSTDEHNRGFQAISEDWLDEWLRNSGDNCRYGFLFLLPVITTNSTSRTTSWTLRKIVRMSDDECRGIKVHIESLARQIAYRGSVDVVFHGLTMEDHTMSLPQTVEGQRAELRVEWSWAHLFTPQDTSRDHCIMNAMVDRTKGFVSFDNPGPSYGMSPFRRAIKPGSRIVSGERDAVGVKHSVRIFSPWGSEE